MSVLQQRPGGPEKKLTEARGVVTNMGVHMQSSIVARQRCPEEELCAEYCLQGLGVINGIHACLSPISDFSHACKQEIDARV